MVFENFEQCEALISEHFGGKEFAFISNRINSYSIILTDAPLLNEKYKNLKAYATVAYTALGERVFEVESHFFNFNKEIFDKLTDAVEWVENVLKKQDLLN